MSTALPTERVPATTDAWGRVAGPRWVLPCLLLASALVFGPALRGAPVYDDLLLIERNPALHSLANLPRYFRHALWDFVPGVEDAVVGFWRPLTLALFGLAHALGDGAPWIYHLMALLAHLAAIAAVWSLARRWCGTWQSAAIASALFALHPLHVEPLAWISALNDPVAGALLLWSLERWVAWRARGAAALPWASAVLGICALLTKESALLLPPLLVLCEVLRPRNLAPAPRRAWWGVAALVALYWAARIAVFGDLAGGFDRPGSGDFHFDGERLVQLRVELLGGALGLLAWPRDLVLFRMLSPNLAWTDARLALGAGAIAVWLLLVARAWKGGARAELFGWLLVPLALAPLLLVPQSAGRYPLSDRYLYVACAGFALAVAQRSSAFGRVGVATGLLAAAALGWRAHAQLPVWRDELALYEHQVSAVAENPYAWWSLGRVELQRYQDSGDVELLLRARASFERAQDLVDRSRSPSTHVFATPEDFVQANLGVGFCLLQEADVDGFRDYESALRFFELVIEARPDRAEPRLGKAQALLALERYEEAERCFQDAALLEPGRVELHQNWGILALRRGDWESARKHFENALAQRPRDPEDRLNLARALTELGWTERAREEAETAMRLAPESAEPLVLLAALAARARDGSGALELLDRALALDGRAVDAHYLQGQVLASRGDQAGAIQAFRRAAELDPEHADAHYNLGALLLASGAREAAQPYLVRAYEFARSARVLVELRALFAADSQASADLYWQLARADESRGAAEQSRAWLEEGQRRDPNHAGTQYLLGVLCEREARFPEAVAHLSRAAELEPTSFEARFSLARALEAIGDLQRALSTLEAARELRPANTGDPAFEAGLVSSLEERIASLRARL